MHIVQIDTPMVFQALADACRLRVMRLLVTTQDEACLCEFVDCLQEPQSKLSRHLKALRQAGLLSAERSGRWVYHRLVTEPAYLRSLHQAIAQLEDPDQIFAQDLRQFRERCCLREDGRCRMGIQTPRLADADDHD